MDRLPQSEFDLGGSMIDSADLYHGYGLLPPAPISTNRSVAPVSERRNWFLIALVLVIVALFFFLRRTPALAQNPEEEDESYPYLRVRCHQCEALVIQGTATHETGCPLSDKRWIKSGRELVPSNEPEEEEYDDFREEDEEEHDGE